MSKPVFVVLTAKKCPHCNTFLRNWPDLQNVIENTGLVSIIKIDVNSTSDHPTYPQYPADLKNWIGWYPTFFLFRGTSWDIASTNPEAKLEGIIYNGHRKNDGTGNQKPELLGREPPTKDNLLNWISRESPALKSGGGKGPSILSLLAAGFSSSSSSKIYTIPEEDTDSERPIEYIPTPGTCGRFRIRGRNRFD